MADEADITEDRAETVLRGDIVASKKPEGPHANGRCHYCDEIVDDHMRWCDVDCLNLWEREQARGVFR